MTMPFTMVSIIIYFTSSRVKINAHPDEFAIQSLPEIRGPGIVIHLHGNLVHPGQRMQDTHAFFGGSQFFRGKNIAVFQADIIRFIEETLPL